MKPRAVMAAALGFLMAPGILNAAFQLQDDDRVVFFGDSFIEGQAVSIYVESFVRVRYPQLKTRFINPATRHFTAREGRQRLPEVLGPLAPTVVVVVFGYQDPDRKPLDEDKLADFRRDYTAIVESIRALGAKPVLVTPPCPQTRRLPRRPNVDYRAVLARYAATVQEVGTALDVAVVDWFGRSAELLSEAQDAAVSPRTSVMPPPLAQVVLSGMLLKHWQAEPIAVTITADWRSGQATVSAGRIAVHRDGDQALSLRISDLPLPWSIKSVSTRDLYQSNWPGSELCRYTLILKNGPPSIQAVLGSKGVPLDAAELSAGIDITGWAPLQSHNAALGILQKYIAEKSRYQGKYWGEVRPRRPQEPELQLAFELYSKALQEFEIGFHRIILGVPKTFDVSLDFTVPPAAEPSPPALNGNGS